MATTQALCTPPDILQLLAHRVRWQILSNLARGDQRVSELVRLVGQPINLVSYHLKRLKQNGLVVERRSSTDSRAVYYSVNLARVRALLTESGEALHPALGSIEPLSLNETSPRSAKPIRVLFLCTHNSARSQMAEGILRHLGKARVEVFSAGNEPGTVHPYALRVLADMGVDSNGQRSKHLHEFTEQRFDYIITICDRVRESSPVFPGDPEHIHWSLADPAEVQGDAARLRAFEQTAQQLQLRIQHLLILIARERGNK